MAGGRRMPKFGCEAYIRAQACMFDRQLVWFAVKETSCTWWSGETEARRAPPLDIELLRKSNS